MMEKDWRDSNAPKWVKDAVEAEIEAWRLTAALSWPTEAKPAPLPFRWGIHGHLTGEPKPGTYWTARCVKFDLDRNDGKSTSWKSWNFRGGGDWSSSAVRGPLFDNEHDARLWMLWEECTKAAKHLASIRAKL